MRTRLTIALGLLAALFVSGAAVSSAVATPPLAMSSGFVTDEAGVMSASEVTVADERLAEVASAGRGELFFVYVDDFTDPSDSVAWADQTASANGLGSDQYLFAIAIEADQYALSIDSAGPLSDSDLDRLEAAVRPELRAGDWSGAIFAAADAMPGQTSSGSSGSGSTSALTWVLVFAAIAAVVAVIWVFVSRARQKSAAATQPGADPNDPYASVSDAELAQQAGSALVQADDAITSSRQELGFAIAQYGDDSAAVFTQVVDAASAKVSEAFALKQQIDDEIPDTSEQQRAWNIQIIQLCTEAGEILGDNVMAFDALRALEAQAPDALERVRTRRASAGAALGATGPALAELAQVYDAAALAAVSDNPAQARQRLSLADAAIADAAAAIAAQKNGEAAFAIRTAEEALSQAEQLEDSVSSLGKNLAIVEDQSRAVIVDLEADIAAASAMPEAQGALAPVIARTRANIDAAAAALQGGSRNPQQVLDRLEQTNAEIDAAIGQTRQAAEQAQRAQRTLDQRMAQAYAQITTANDFIAARRGAIGATARTRLAEANSAYAEAAALAPTDLHAAIDRATRSYSLATEALNSARNEFDMFNSGGYGSSGGGGSFGGAILGGMLGGMLTGGSSRRSRGGWGYGGSSGWSSGGTRSSRRSSSRSSRSSSFGGGSRGGSRGGGSSRGGSRGGRF